MPNNNKIAKNGKNLAISILIPVYNEEKTLQEILERTTSLPIKNFEVIIVDDASKDSSPAIIKRFLRSFNRRDVYIRNFRHDVNRGKGAGIKTALEQASGEYFVIQDADLEYDPGDIPRLLAKATREDLDAVYGSRFLGTIKNMPRANYIANRGYNLILRIMYKTKITDMHTCYKMVRTSLMKELGITSNGFDYATELVSKLLNRKVKIHEVPVSFYGRTKKEGKKINVMDGVECAYKLIRYRYTRTDKLFSEKSTTLLRFMIVGATGFTANYITLVFIQSFGINHIIAEAIAAVFALNITFIFHDRWTYRLQTPEGTEKLGSKSRYIAYIISNAFGSMVTIASFSILYNYTYRLPSLLIAAITGLIWNYLMNTYVIWRRKK